MAIKLDPVEMVIAQTAEINNRCSHEEAHVVVNDNSVRVGKVKLKLHF